MNRRYIAHVLAALTLVAGIHLNVGVAAAASTAVENCDGWQLRSANYVRHTGSGAEVGSIQLCLRYINAERFHMAWIHMYSPLPAGYWASAYLYVYAPGTATRVDLLTCQDYAGGTVQPGETTCRTPWKRSFDPWNADYIAVGRAYYSNGSGGWTLYADGATARMRQDP